MSNRQSFFKIHSSTLSQNRKIIGIDINKENQYRYYKPVKTKAEIDTFKEIQKKCTPLWNNCVNDKICNKVLAISQKVGSGVNITKQEETYISTYKNNYNVVKIIECTANIGKAKESTTQQAKESIDNLNNQASIYIQPVNIYEKLFNNKQEYESYYNEFKYKFVKIDETNEIISINQLIDKGLVNLNLFDQNFNTDTKIEIIGGIYDKKNFYNRKTYTILFKNLVDYKSNSYPYFKENKFNILGTEEYLSINDLYSKGMTDFTLPISEVWNQDSTFKIVGGEYNGKFFKNKIDEYIEKSIFCNYISQIPYLGEKICGSTDYSIYFIVFIVILLIIIAFLFFRSKKNPKLNKSKKILTQDEMLAIKKAKLLQMEFNE